MVSLLTLVFDLPIHQAVGTSLAAMFFVTIAGSISNFQEGNTNVRVGLLVGIAGAVAGADIGQSISEHILQPMRVSPSGRWRSSSSCALA